MAKKVTFAAGICALLLAQTGAGLAQQPEKSTPTSPPMSIGPVDQVDVTMFESPELSGHFRVDAQGDITLPLLGRVHVQGKTAEEVATTVERRYVEADILKQDNAHATVFLAEYTTQKITVNGEVKSPGMLPALGVRMLNEVITSAGGELPTASSNVVITRKSDPGNPITIEYNPWALTPVIPQVQIFPGDSILVPKAGVVYVLGDVVRSGAYVLDGRRPLTVEVVMGMAGGGGRGAALKKVHLVRTLEGGQKEDVVLAVNQIYKGKAPDVVLKDGDILWVPTSTAKLATEQGISSALGIGTQIVTYRSAQ